MRTEIRSNLDLLEEVREKACLHQIVHQQTTARHFNDKVKLRPLQVGDFFLRLNQFKSGSSEGKLKESWEGPYQISNIVGPGAYKIRTEEGKDVWFRSFQCCKSKPIFFRRQGFIQSSRSSNPSAVKVHLVDSTTLTGNSTARCSQSGTRGRQSPKTTDRPHPVQRLRPPRPRPRIPRPGQPRLQQAFSPVSPPLRLLPRQATSHQKYPKRGYAPLAMPDSRPTLFASALSLAISSSFSSLNLAASNSTAQYRSTSSLRRSASSFCSRHFSSHLSTSIPKRRTSACSDSKCSEAARPSASAFSAWINRVFKFSFS
ncbi:Rve domain-containing protein [Quillaja saponaria]|uniref:Rve domain-containing protein n=1 Tax=Quillaja saponaria TaxID=32244 RepID=A0AAD7PDW8_QUISA|nr:Rve domain-containing protein [Quillaja saponaria]